MQDRHSSKLPLALVVGASAFLTGCGDQDVDNVVYCVDRVNVIIDQQSCENEDIYEASIQNGSPIFYNIGPHEPGLPIGTQLEGGELVSVDDEDGISKKKLKKAGKVVFGKAAGFGKTSVSSGFGGDLTGGFGGGRSGGFGGLRCAALVKAQSAKTGAKKSCNPVLSI